MEVAFFVVAILGLLALSGSSSASAQPPLQGVYSSPPPQPWTPSIPSTVGPPMVPSNTANIDGQLFSGGAQIGTAALKTTTLATSLVPVVGAAIAVAASIAAALLAAHQARLKGATNENQAVDQYVPVFDSFVSQLVQAYNSGQISAAQAAQVAQQFDRYIYNAFRSLVGRPGTAWSDSVGMAGQCNSSCTVGCCVYYGDLGPVLNNISYVLGYSSGKWGQGDPRISGRTVTVPKVYPSKYSSYTRQLYTITLN